MRNGDLALLREEPFVLTQKTSTIRKIVDSVFKNAGFTPNVLFETSNNHAIISMIHENICCGILPMYYMDPSDPAITYFELPDHPSWEIVAAYRKGHYISKPARTLMSLREIILRNKSLINFHIDSFISLYIKPYLSIVSSHRNNDFSINRVIFT